MSERGQSSTTISVSGRNFQSWQCVWWGIQNKVVSLWFVFQDLVREVLKLVDPRVETAVADFLGRLPWDVLQMMIQGEPDSLIEILKPCYVEVDILRRTAYATWIKRRVLFFIQLSKN